MTRERKLAIQMWEDIKLVIRLGNLNFLEYKSYFKITKQLKWEGGCWFCQYVRECSKCPLRYYATSLLHHRAWCCFAYNVLQYDIEISTKTKLFCCDIIIKALQGKNVKKDYKKLEKILFRELEK